MYYIRGMNEDLFNIDDLKEFISENYRNKTMFIEEFNNYGGRLDGTVLSRQLNGKRNLSKFATAAYSFFIKIHDLEKQLSEIKENRNE